RLPNGDPSRRNRFLTLRVCHTLLAWSSTLRRLAVRRFATFSLACAGALRLRGWPPHASHNGLLSCAELRPALLLTRRPLRFGAKSRRRAYSHDETRFAVEPSARDHRRCACTIRSAVRTQRAETSARLCREFTRRGRVDHRCQNAQGRRHDSDWSIAG